MEKSLIDIKNELIEWIENTFDREILQKAIDLKNENPSLISDINSGKMREINFDEQFAAGMSSDELMENIAAHIESISSEETAVVSDVEPEYAVRDDFEERFAKGISSEEMRRRTIAHIRSLPWEK
jgi:predicted small metal-binding protein